MNKKWSVFFVVGGLLLVILLGILSRGFSDWKVVATFASINQRSAVFTGGVSLGHELLVISNEGKQFGADTALYLNIFDIEKGFQRQETLLPLSSQIILANGQCLSQDKKVLYLAWAERSPSGAVSTLLGSWSLDTKKMEILQRIDVLKESLYPSGLLCTQDNLVLASYLIKDTKTSAVLWTYSMSEKKLQQVSSDLNQTLGRYSLINFLTTDAEGVLWAVGHGSFKNSEDKFSGFTMKSRDLVKGWEVVDIFQLHPGQDTVFQSLLVEGSLSQVLVSGWGQNESGERQSFLRGQDVNHPESRWLQTEGFPVSKTILQSSLISGGGPGKWLLSVATQNKEQEYHWYLGHSQQTNKNWRFEEPYNIKRENSCRGGSFLVGSESAVPVIFGNCAEADGRWIGFLGRYQP